MRRVGDCRLAGWTDGCEGRRKGEGGRGGGGWWMILSGLGPFRSISLAHPVPYPLNSLQASWSAKQRQSQWCSKDCWRRTRLTSRLRFPLNTSPCSTHRFHAHKSVWSVKYPTTATSKTGRLSIKDILYVYAIPPNANRIEP